VFLQSLRLYQFKNYEELQVNFGEGINCFLGKNGSGKTNLLDAIHYLAFTKSAINSNDSLHIRWGGNQFLIKGLFIKEGKARELICQVQAGQKKTIREDGQDYSRFADHIGKYPLVIIAPQDIELIWGGGELRRKFFDTLLCQLNREYLENLIVYNHQLRQRNSVLKKFSESGAVDYDLIESYDVPLSQAGNYIYQSRTRLIQDLLPLLINHYSFIADTLSENPVIQYRSDLEGGDFSAQLKQNISRDVMLQRTGSGVHRDEFIFLLNGNELKKTGSQGQQKSFLIALKLTEFQLISNGKGFKPLLLLDDIFDKLDNERIKQLMRLVTDGLFGQLFITDAREDRSLQILREAGVAARIFTVENSNLLEHGQ
jgi:DNA replication and repair protein RecF